MSCKTWTVLQNVFCELGWEVRPFARLTIARKVSVILDACAPR